MKLSIITINYNNLEGLKRTYESVVCQTWTDYEWIIIDGGSTDGSREFIEEHQDKFAYWCSEPDKGVYNAMNKGIAKAHGEYLNFMNSGDCFYNRDTLLRVSLLKESADIISGRVVRQDNGKLLRIYDKNIFMQLYKDTLNHQGTFIRKTLFEAFGYDEKLKVVADWKFWIETIIWNSSSIEYIDTIVATQDMKGISNTDFQQMENERKCVLNEKFPMLLQKELAEYDRLRHSEYVIRSEYLLSHNSFCYVLGRRFLSFLIWILK